MARTQVAKPKKPDLQVDPKAKKPAVGVAKDAPKKADKAETKNGTPANGKPAKPEKISCCSARARTMGYERLSSGPGRLS